MGNVYYLQGDLEQTVSYYQSAMCYSDDKEWKGLLAQSLAKIYQEHYGNYDAAQASMQLAVELNPEELDYHVQLGVVSFEKEDYHTAEATYEKAITKFPYNPLLFSSLGYMKWMDHQIDEAVALYERSMELDPYYEVPYNNLGVIYLDSIGDIQKAIELFMKAKELNANYSLAYYNLGRAYGFLGDSLEAVHYFQQAREVNQYTQDLDNEELDNRINSLFNTVDS